MAVGQIISSVFQFSRKKSLKIDREKSEKRSKNYETSETDFSGGYEKSSTSTTSNYNYFVIFGELFLRVSPICRHLRVERLDDGRREI